MTLRVETNYLILNVFSGFTLAIKKEGIIRSRVIRAKAPTLRIPILVQLTKIGT